MQEIEEVKECNCNGLDVEDMQVTNHICIVGFVHNTSLANEYDYIKCLVGSITIVRFLINNN